MPNGGSIKAPWRAVKFWLETGIDSRQCYWLRFNTFMPKVAGALVPSVDQFLDKVQRYGPGFFLAGAGTAGMLHMLRMRNEEQKAQEAAKPSNDVLTVTLPRKLAAWGGDILRWAKTNPLKAGLGGAAAAGIVARDMTHVPTTPDNYLADAGMKATAILGSSALGYGIINSILENRRKKQLQDQFTKAKGDYGNLLGNVLAQPKAAELDQACPVLFGAICAVADQSLGDDERKSASVISNLVSAPSALMVISGILSHQWMYNREKELAALHQNVAPKPPKEVRFVTAPPAQPLIPPGNAPALESPQRSDDFDEVESKNAGGTGHMIAADLAADGILLSMIDSKREGGEKPPGAQPGKPLVPPTAPPPAIAPIQMVDVAPGTTIGQTANGPVSFEAEDPNAARVLHQNKGRLKQLLGMMQARSADPEQAPMSE